LWRGELRLELDTVSAPAIGEGGGEAEGLWATPLSLACANG